MVLFVMIACWKCNLLNLAGVVTLFPPRANPKDAAIAQQSRNRPPKIQKRRARCSCPIQPAQATNLLRALELFSMLVSHPSMRSVEQCYAETAMTGPTFAWRWRLMLFLRFSML